MNDYWLSRVTRRPQRVFLVERYMKYTEEVVPVWSFQNPHVCTLKVKGSYVNLYHNEKVIETEFLTEKDIFERRFSVPVRLIPGDVDAYFEEYCTGFKQGAVQRVLSEHPLDYSIKPIPVCSESLLGENPILDFHCMSNHEGSGLCILSGIDCCKHCPRLNSVCFDLSQKDLIEDPYYGDFVKN